MGAQFTPGPWRVAVSTVREPDGPALWPYIQVYAGAGFFEGNTGPGFELSGIARPADGYMLAAAPRLHEALAALLKEWEQIYDGTGPLNQLAQQMDAARDALSSALPKE